MLIAVASAKGAAGATTFAVALAAVWPHEGALVVEADCAGGDLSCWHWLPDSPGLGTLATQCRTGSVVIDQHAVRLPCGVDAVLAPAGRQPVTVAVGLLADSDLGVWTKQRVTIADVGRLEPGAPSAGLAERAEVLLVVSRGDVASLLRLADLDLSRSWAHLVLVGGSAYPAAEIADQVGLPIAAQVPWDPHAAAVIGGRRTAGRGWTHRGLPAAARAVATQLAASRTYEGRR